MNPALFVLAAVASSAVLAQTPPCFESNIGPDLQLGDDQVTTRALGFTFPFAGRSTAVISISSNGFVWLGSNSDSGCCNGSLAEFLSELARIAVVWTDLDPSSGGSVHLATFPGRAVVTWNAVPEYGEFQNITAQVQLLADGAVIVAWQSPLAVVSHATLVGITPGGSTPGVRALDFTTALPVNTGTSPTVYEVFGPSQVDVGGMVASFVPNGQGGYQITRRSDCSFAGFSPIGSGCPPALPVTLVASAASRPAIGTNFDMVVGDAPAGATAAAMLYGTDAGGISLTALGMPGCTLYSTGAFLQPFVVQGRYSVVTLPIPPVQALIGTVLHNQAALVAPGANPRGIVASNGGRIEIGT
jgi:hypothetical protein